MANEFLVSVADVVLRDPTSGNAYAYGKANISSAFTLSMQSADVRAGINNPLLFSYYHTREMTIKVEDATFNETILALNAGATVAVGAVNVLQTECLTLSASGSGVISLTPVGNVNVFLPNGTIENVTPSTKDITVSGGANARVDVVYVTSKSADQITIASTTPPSIVDLTLIAEIRAADQTTVKKYLQINIPQFQVAGNYTLNLSANGVSTQALEGKALVSFATDCTSGDYYAKVTYIPVSTSSAYSYIAATPSAISFSQAARPQSQSITVLGIRGGVYQNTNITTSCSFVKSGSAGSHITCGSLTGVVTAGSDVVSGETALIMVNYATGSLLDSVNVTVGA
jgi:hypothetical protein